MSVCQHCGFSVARPDGFCGDNCKIGWSRRTTDPFYWTNYIKPEDEAPGMTEETKQKLREYAQKKKLAREKEKLDLQEDNKKAAEELEF